MGKPFDFMVHKLCKQILSKVTALPDTIAAVKTAVADMAKYVATNNTASKTGILSQKITYLINQNEAHGSVERTTAGSQNWACPAGVYQVLVIATGGSGGGGGGGGKAISSKVWTNWKGAGGGGSGGTSEIVYALAAVMPGKTYALNVGAGGSAGKAGTDGTLDNKNAGNGGDGGKGGDTKFGDIITVAGGGGGTGGKGAIWSDNNITNAIGGTGGTGGEGGAVTFGGSFKNIILHLFAKSRGNAGMSGEVFSGSSTGNAGGAAGGAAVKNALGLSSGAGGKGGDAHRSHISGNSGAAGAVGSPGYIKVIW